MATTTKVSKHQAKREESGVSDGPGPRVWVTLGRKISTGNYENLDVQIGAADDVHGDEDIGQAIVRLKEACKAELKRTLRVLPSEV